MERNESSNSNHNGTQMITLMTRHDGQGLRTTDFLWTTPTGFLSSGIECNVMQMGPRLVSIADTLALGSLTNNNVESQVCCQLVLELP